ncbi:MAG: efflux RND transporter periplasmic adaptor subunit [Chromatiales bacterium]|nr:MAG: efflux RND transporter periplasmic adaptor subunit [Chromatiales bacterium]
MTEQPPAKLKVRARRALLPLVIVAVTAGVIALMIATRPRLIRVPTPERVWPVEVVEARFGPLQPQLSLFGEIVGGRRSELRPQVAGLVVEIGPNLQEGGQVEKGELLLRIDPFDFETALAEQRSLLKESEARLEKLRRDLKRTQDLYAQKNVSEQALDDAALAVIEQEALVEQRVIGVRRAERDLADTQLAAPFAGVLANVAADLGKEFTGFGNEAVADLIDTSELEVRFSVTNAQYGRLAEDGEPLIGRLVAVSWQVGDATLVYPAVIERVGAEVTASTGGVDAFAAIDSSGEQTLLRPGVFVSVTLADRRYDNVISVPESALYGEDTVYVIEAGRMSPRQVKVAGYSGADLLVTNAGDPAIRDGDQVVVTQLREAGAGAQVTVR